MRKSDFLSIFGFLRTSRSRESRYLFNGMSIDFCQRVSDCMMDGQGSKSPSPAPEEAASRHNSRESDSGGLVEKRKKHRRGKRRRNKPYHTLTAEEKKKVDEKTQERCEKRQQTFARLRRPVAPENTTQFLMEDREEMEPKLPSPSRVPPIRHHSHSMDSSDDEDMYESPEDDSLETELFLEEDFANAYQEHHMERLQSMGKDELMDEYLSLEKNYNTMEATLQNSENKISSLEQELKLLKQQHDSVDTGSSSS